MSGKGDGDDPGQTMGPARTRSVGWRGEAESGSATARTGHGLTMRTAGLARGLRNTDECFVVIGL